MQKFKKYFYKSFSDALYGIFRAKVFSFVRDQRALSRDISLLILFQSYQSLLQDRQWHHLYVQQSVPLLLEYACITVLQELRVFFNVLTYEPIRFITS